MENERKFIVYKHTSPDDKCYIGLTCRTLNGRCGHEGNNYKQQKVFYAAIQKFGWENISHEVLFENLSEDYARVLERAFIFIYKSNNPDFGYNNTEGGEKPQPPEQSEKMKGEKNPMYGVHRYGEQHPMWGKHHKEESKRKMSQNHKDNSGEKHHMFGKHHKMETRNKISYGVSEFNKGHHWYNNGIIETFSYECPDGFVQGRLYRPRRKRK